MAELSKLTKNTTAYENIENKDRFLLTPCSLHRGIDALAISNEVIKLEN